MRKWAARIVIVLYMTVATILGWNFLKSLAKVNEPDPAKFDPAIIVRNLKIRGVDVRVDRVLYVYLDVFSYVFEGEIKNIDQTKWKLSRSIWIGNEKGIICSGEGKSGARLIGFCDQLAKYPMEPHFEKYWFENVTPSRRLVLRDLNGR